MTSVADLVEEAELGKLATADELKRGSLLAEEGRVQLERFAPLSVTAVVEDGPLFEVGLWVTDERLAWACTCPGGGRVFCAHAVAAARDTLRRAPRKRR
jgi:uncharacterized Zn finger protein